MALAGAGILVACGGGGGSDSTPNNVVPARSTGKISLSGVVAVGQAVANAQVQIRCLGADNVNVTVTATTDAAGNYGVDVPNASLPCVLSVNTTDSNLAAVVLSSLAQGAGAGTAVANITPVTTLVVANVADADPAAYIAGFGPTSAARITAPAVSTAVTEVTDLLAGAGVSLPAGVNVLTGPLVAATGSTTGNAYDQALDALAQTLTTAGTTLAELATTVAVSTPATPAVATTSNAPSLPADLLLLPKAATCAALRSTTYQTVDFEPSATTGDSDPVTTVDRFTLDAQTLVTTGTDGLSDPAWVPVAGDACHFTAGTGTDIVVSPAGVLGARTSNVVGGVITQRLAIGMPVQDIPVAELAGTWNLLSLVHDGAPTLTAEAGTAVVDASGQVTSARCFGQPFATSSASCLVQTVLLPRFTVNIAGGFDLTSSDPTEPWKDRRFAYRSGNGQLMMVAVEPNGAFGFMTRQQASLAPTVGAINASWNITVDTAGVAIGFGANTNTIQTVNPDGTFTRANTTVGASPVDTRTETLKINDARDGYNHRFAAVATNAANTQVNVREFYSLSLRGMGLSATALPAGTHLVNSTLLAEQFSLGVNKP